MKVLKGILTVIIAGIALGVQAQQQPLFTQYQFSALAFNPGYVRNNDAFTIQALHRTQWAGFEGAPQTQIITAAKPIEANASVGVSLVHHQIGVSRNIAFNAIYGYGIKLNKGELAIGLQASVINWSGNWDQLDFRDPQTEDPVFENRSFSRFFFNAGAGLFYHNKRYYFGISASSLFNNKMIAADGAQSSVQRHLYLMAGYLVPLKKDGQIFLKPSILLRGVGWLEPFFKEGEELYYTDVPTQLDADLALVYKQLMIGVTLRTAVEYFTNQSSSLTSGNFWCSFLLKNGLRLGVAYDYSLTEIKTHQVGSFEIMAGFEFGSNAAEKPYPRYF